MMEALPVASILLVDDHPANLLALEAALEPLGQRLVQAHSGAEALRRASEEDFAAILLDVQMPELDGYQTARLIKSQERSRHVPLLFLSAIHREERQVLRGYSQGAADYLLKPLDPDVLRAKVAVFVDLYQRQEQLRQREARLRQQERELLLRQSEAHARAILEAMPQAVWASRSDDAHAWCNPAWARLMAGPGAGAARDTFLEAVHPEEREAVEAGWREALCSGLAWEAQHRMGHPGAWRWYRLRVTPLPEAGKLWRGFLCTATDIDDERRNHQVSQLLSHASVVLSSSLDFRATLARLAQLVVPRFADWCAVDVLDEERPEAGLSRVAVAHVESTKAEKVLELHRRYPPREDSPSGVGRVLASGTPELLLQVSDSLLQRLVTDEEHAALLREVGFQSCIHVPMRARERNFGVLTFALSGRRHRYDPRDLALAEELGRRAAVAMDNALLYREAQRAQRVAQEANRLKDEFLATLSHELRTPLTSILGWTQMLLKRDDMDEPHRRRGLAIIERNARVQRQLVEDLLDVSRITSGKLLVNLKEVALREVVEAALESARPTAEVRGVQLQAELGPLNETVLADATRLQQVLWNLLTNAIKFTDRGGQVSLSASRSGAMVELVVRDTGKGIPRELLPHIFERFRQGEIGREQGGLGLGLAIVRHLVELHGGAVEVASDGPGLGSAFTVRLPLRAHRQECLSVPEAAVLEPEAQGQCPVSEELVAAVALLMEQAAR